MAGQPKLAGGCPPPRRSALWRVFAVTRKREGEWSGRRGSNPRPTAWKAVTLPLSYSRLRVPHCAPRFGGQARLTHPFPACLAASAGKPASRNQIVPAPRFELARPDWLCQAAFASLVLRLPSRRSPLTRRLLACQPSLARSSVRAKVGGEGRTRTFEAARATDLQSAAFDRFATSPAVCVFWKLCFPERFQYDGAGEGI